MKHYKGLCYIMIVIAILCYSIESYAKDLTASWYDLASLKREGTFKYSKGRMANNEYFDENVLTCASWDFPLSARLKVTNVKNPEKYVIVVNSDRTARRFKGKRLDLSKGAFREIAPLEQGLCKVSVKVVRQEELR